MTAIRLTAALALLLGLGSANAADVMVVQPPPATMAMDSNCSDSGALREIKGRFAWAERHTWHRGFVMAELGNPRPSGHPFPEPGIVERDFCQADAVMNNGMPYQVFYVVEHGLGFVGIGSEVDYCVLGLDPWHVHDGDCRTVR